MFYFVGFALLPPTGEGVSVREKLCSSSFSLLKNQTSISARNRAVRNCELWTCDPMPDDQSPLLRTAAR